MRKKSRVGIFGTGSTSPVAVHRTGQILRRTL